MNEERLDPSLERIRATLARMQRVRGRRFSPDTREMVAGAAGRLGEDGQNWTKIGRARGLPADTPRRLLLVRTTNMRVSHETIHQSLPASGGEGFR